MVMSITTAIQAIGRIRNGSLKDLGEVLLAVTKGEPYQVGAGAPTITSRSIGEWYFDSTNLVFYRSTVAGSASAWIIATRGGSLVVGLAVTTVLTLAAHGGRTIAMSGAGGARTFTLWAPTGAGTRIKFVVDEVNTSGYLIKAAAGTQIFRGTILSASTTDSATDAVNSWTAGSTDDTLTLDGTTTGGVTKGDWVEFEDISATHWNVRGVTTQSGTEATPFSDTVT